MQAKLRLDNVAKLVQRHFENRCVDSLVDETTFGCPVVRTAAMGGKAMRALLGNRRKGRALEKDQTAFAALENFARQKELKVDFKGQGETLFVMGIGEVTNQGAGGINWTYRINGELGDRSSGIFSLKPGDKVLWIFGKYP